MITNLITSSFAVLSNNKKLVALETSLQQSILEYKDVLIDLEQLQISYNNLKAQYTELKEKCASQTCCGAEGSQKVLQAAQSALTRLCVTKDLFILNEIFQLIFGKATTLSYQEIFKFKDSSGIKEELVTPKKELHSSAEDLSFRDESVSEIEGTPTGRSSPIIPSKKIKSSVTSLLDREKKKCPKSWSTPDIKTRKTDSTLSQSKKNRTLRQGRLPFMNVKPSYVIDITDSPEFNGGSRAIKAEMPLIKKEPIENDDTILPSPTSGPTDFTAFKSPLKCKKQNLSLKTKMERASKVLKIDQDIENKATSIKCERNDKDTEKCVNEIKNHSVTYTQDDSINILHPNRLPNNFMKRSPAKQDHTEATVCDTQASVSLLRHVNELDSIHNKRKLLSPEKEPLRENINVANLPDDDELQASVSVLQRDGKINRLPVDSVKRKIAAPVFNDEDPTPRTRAEKRLLPGWACRECINFFSELHKDDPEMMRKKINECSHHRGVTNPERPRTPPGYWNPRWNVPDDTEEFNRKNNA